MTFGLLKVIPIFKIFKIIKGKCYLTSTIIKNILQTLNNRKRYEDSCNISAFWYS